MWKLHNGKLIQTTDPTRKRFKTRISQALVMQLKQMAEDHYTHVGYLLENGFENLLVSGQITFDKRNRPKDRIEFRTTCDEELLSQLKDFAKIHQLNLNDVIEYSTTLIKINQVKDGDYRYRIE